MGICDLLENWDDIGPSSDRFTELRDFVNDMLQDWGFDAPNWRDQPAPGIEDSTGVYMRDTDTIYLNPDWLSETTAEEAMSIAVHEGLYAAYDQAGWNVPDEEVEAGILGMGVSQDVLDASRLSTVMSFASPTLRLAADTSSFDTRFAAVATLARRTAEDDPIIAALELLCAVCGKEPHPATAPTGAEPLQVCPLLACRPTGSLC